MSNLVSWSTYCNCTGTATNSSDQSIVESTLIPIASDTVETYCNRLFTETIYVEWSQNNLQTYFPANIPVNKLYSVAICDRLCTITNPTDLNIAISKDALTIHNPRTLDDDEYLFTSYANVSSLFTAIVNDYADIDIVYNSSYTVSDLEEVNSKLLLPATLDIVDAATVDINAALVQQSYQRLLDGGITLTCPDEQNCIVYKGGYNPIPMDLQYVICQIIQDMLSQSKGDQSNNMKSETIDNYSYTLQDGVNLADLVRSKYGDALAKYKKVIYG